MFKTRDVPDIVIGRLPIYLRALDRLKEEEHEVVSSKALGDVLGVSPAQIRKDLSHFGGFGKQGTGYRIDRLRDELIRALNIGFEWEVAIVGAGAMADALLREGSLDGRGFRIVALFDSRPERVGLRLHGLQIQSVQQLAVVVAQRKLSVGILSVPAAEAQETAELMVRSGIRAILSFAPVSLVLPANVQVQVIDAGAALQQMAYYLRGPAY